MFEFLEKLHTYLLGIWLKRRYVIITAWLVAPLGWIYSLQLPDEYASTSKIYVDTKTLLRPLLRGLTIDTDPAQQLRMMTRTLLSRDNLEKIARLADLDLSTNSELEYEELLESLKKDIVLIRDRKDNLFTIKYEHTDPRKAQAVVQSTIDVFIESTLGENRTDTATAHKFLDAQISEYERRLEAAEMALTEFKRKHSGMMPGQGGGYYQKLAATRQQLEQSRMQLLESQTRLESAKLQLLDAEESQANMTAPRFELAKRQYASQYDGRIGFLESQLDELLLRFTEQHPDVREINIRLDDLRAMRNEELKQLTEISEQATSPMNGNVDPIYQSLKLNVNQLESEVASLEVRVSNFEGKVKEFEDKIYLIPKIEADLVDLTRGYEVTRSKYRDLLNRKETALIARSAGQASDELDFRVIDPPLIPNKPSSPHRLLLMCASLLVGILGGLGAAFLSSQLRPIVTSGKELLEATGIPILGNITELYTPSLAKAQRMKKLVFAGSNIALFTIFAVLIGLEIQFQIGSRVSRMIAGGVA